VLTFDDIEPGMRLAGVVAGQAVTVLAITRHSDDSAVLTYRPDEGRPDERLLRTADLAGIEEADERRWSFDADGAAFRLASEARRMRHAHLADPFAAVDTSNIEPYPHQIEAVYNRLLPLKPLRFLLADDPGAGKTIMSGLLIRELMLRGDVARCLIVAPGSLVEQWQDELGERFGVDFELMSRAAVEASRSGNPFAEKSLLVARVDQLARSEDLLDKLRVAPEWDLVIVDEAHKMSAHRYGDELRKTKRFELGELLRERTRHLLLLTATPHNGKNEDFLAFMTLLDPERFAGQLRDDEMPDVDDVMRRRVKEKLRTFEGRPLFPKRHAYSLRFELSEPEQKLYEAVTGYVRTGMNRAERMRSEGDAGDKRRGIVIGFALAGLQRRLASSPEAIYQSLRRRRDRLAEQAEWLRERVAAGEPITASELPRGLRLPGLDDFDSDDYTDEERENLEDAAIDAGTAGASAKELDAEAAELGMLVELADEVRNSGVDTKWNELRGLLRRPEFADEGRKLIVFSEHKATLDYVAGRIAGELGCSEAVVTIHGGVKRHDRRAIQDRFRVDPQVRVLVATDAAGEGVNLQAANMMVNYDLPWNPNRIEQRFGRIHRIGQQLPCHLWNLVAHETREGKVFERLFDKIEQQKKVYADQVYDVLGDAGINKSLQELRGDTRSDGESPGTQAPALVRGGVLPGGSGGLRRAHGGTRAGPFRDHQGAGRDPQPSGPLRRAGARALLQGHVRQGRDPAERGRACRADLAGLRPARRCGRKGARRPRRDPAEGGDPGRSRRPRLRAAAAGVSGSRRDRRPAGARQPPGGEPPLPLCGDRPPRQLLRRGPRALSVLRADHRGTAGAARRIEPRRRLDRRPSRGRRQGLRHRAPRRPALRQDRSRRPPAGRQGVGCGAGSAEMPHNNKGYDIESKDPETGHVYRIEVKSHLPQTREIGVSASQVQRAKNDPQRWRLAIASVPEAPEEAPVVRYLVEPFADVTIPFKWTKVSFQIADLLMEATAPC